MGATCSGITDVLLSYQRATAAAAERPGSAEQQRPRGPGDAPPCLSRQARWGAAAAVSFRRSPGTDGGRPSELDAAGDSADQQVTNHDLAILCNQMVIHALLVTSVVPCPGVV